MKLTKKKLGAGVAALAIAVGGASAYAYWTASGSGSGSSSAAASNGAIVLHATFPTGTLYPGGSQQVTFTADNAGSNQVAVGTIHTVVSTPDVPACAADITVADVVSGVVVPATTNGVAVGTGTINFANTNVSQDACKGVSIVLTLSS